MNTMSDTAGRTHAELGNIDDLPTFRQIDYWARSGALGEDKRAPGSGYRRLWTDHEVSKLRALHRVGRDLAAIGFTFRGRGVGLGIPVTIVERIWQLLDDDPTATIRSGGVTIIAATNTVVDS